VLNRSFTIVNSLFPRIFALPESKILSRAKASDCAIKLFSISGPLEAVFYLIKGIYVY